MSVRAIQTGTTECITGPLTCNYSSVSPCINVFGNRIINDSVAAFDDDRDDGPAHLNYSGWEALERIIPGFGRPPRPVPCLAGGNALW